MSWLSSMYLYVTLALWGALLRLHRNRLQHRPAQTVTEFALILFLIGIVCIAIVGLLGVTVKSDWWEKIYSEISKVMPIH